MAGFFLKRVSLLFALFGILGLSVSLCGVANAQKPKIYKTKPSKSKTAAPAPAADAAASAEPDKILYERAVNDVKHGKYTEARLTFQTLINTYPDSEYLAKAKLGVADSYYKEGGVSNLTQAISEYKDFETFFPFLEEAAYAQMQVAMAHFKMTEKSDRDDAQAEAAEDEFQSFLLKYPQSPLGPQAQQHLRDIQEVLADGEFKVAHFYYTKPDYRAAAARLVELTDRYPLYSENDEALWMLGNVYSRAQQASKNEDDKNHWSDLAAQCYDRIIQDYPLSARTNEAKRRLTALGMPVPAADPKAVERMRQQQLYASAHRQKFFIRMPMSLISSKPDLSMAARSGVPTMTPPNDTISATDVLKPGAPGPTFGIAATAEPASGTGSDSEQVDSGSGPEQSVTGAGVQVLTPADSNASGAANPAPATGGAAGQPGATSPSSAPGPPNTAGDPANPGTTSSAPVSGAAAPSVLTPVNGSDDAAPIRSDAPVPDKADATPVQKNPSSSTTASSTQQSQGRPSSPSGTAAAMNAPAPKDPGDTKKESSSKKKKGLKKIVPW